ncbi:MAG: oligopeptidase B, partial [Bacteroidia bacterium]|nr:oligopeptidase B [Bacteroidia bacterium]
MPNTNPWPIAKKNPTELKQHGDIRIDDYYWLNDRDNPEVISYLEAENAYCESVMKHTEDFQTSLFEEMKSRIKKDDQSVPYKYNGYWYIVRYEKGKDYPIYLRKKETLEAPEEILFDCNTMAKGHAYFKLVGISISPDNKLVSFATDLTGRRIYTIQIKNLKTEFLLDTKIENTTGRAIWANDNKTLFYCTKNENTLRSEKVFKHKINSKINDTLVYTEVDETFGVSISKSKSRAYLVIASYQTLTTEYRILKADNPDGEFKIFHPRERGLEYGISHYKDEFYIVTNANNSTNFKLMKTSVSKTSKTNWVELIPHRENVLLEGIEIFKDFLVISERENGLNKIRIKRWDNTDDYYIPFNSETYTAYTTTNVDFNTSILRYSYNALNTPASVIDFDMVNKTIEIKKEQEVLGGKFNKENYRTERIWANANDGVKVPVSIVYHKNTKKTDKTPLILYAYGAYGST